MASVPVGQLNAPQPGPDVIGRVRDSGSSSHPYPTSHELLSGPGAARNLADAIHFLCALHGRHPGVIELVATRTIEPPARAWLHEAAEAFGRERAYLARLAVEAGPLPATPGSGSEAALAMQRGAIMTLAQSERRGCAIGAAIALAADWAVIRSVLDTAAARFSVAVPRSWFGDDPGLRPLAATLSENASVGRALLFGAEQVALQHRGLWDLLRARAQARG
ncbi:MAG TPA: hypothetical protein VGB54_14895 [Allosphingosinicella sp.]